MISWRPSNANFDKILLQGRAGNVADGAGVHDNALVISRRLQFDSLPEKTRQTLLMIDEMDADLATISLPEFKAK